MGNAEFRDAVRRSARDVLPPDMQRPRGRGDRAADGAREGRLAGAVGAEDGDGFALRNRQVDTFQYARLAVARADPFELEQRDCRSPFGRGRDQG